MAEDETQPDPDTLRKIIHDLNGDLFLIRGYADLASTRFELEPQVAQYLEKIVAQCDDLEATIGRLREKQLQLEP